MTGSSKIDIKQADGFKAQRCGHLQTPTENTGNEKDAPKSPRHSREKKSQRLDTDSPSSRLQVQGLGREIDDRNSDRLVRKESQAKLIKRSSTRKVKRRHRRSTYSNREFSTNQNNDHSEQTTHSEPCEIRQVASTQDSNRKLVKSRSKRKMKRTQRQGAHNDRELNWCQNYDYSEGAQSEPPIVREVPPVKLDKLPSQRKMRRSERRISTGDKGVNAKQNHDHSECTTQSEPCIIREVPPAKLSKIQPHKQKARSERRSSHGDRRLLGQSQRGHVAGTLDLPATKDKPPRLAERCESVAPEEGIGTYISRDLPPRMAERCASIATPQHPSVGRAKQKVHAIPEATEEKDDYSIDVEAFRRRPSGKAFRPTLNSMHKQDSGLGDYLNKSSSFLPQQYQSANIKESFRHYRNIMDEYPDSRHSKERQYKTGWESDTVTIYSEESLSAAGDLHISSACTRHLFQSVKDFNKIMNEHDSFCRREGKEYTTGWE